MSAFDPARRRGLVSLIARHPTAANLILLLMVLFGIYAIARINTQFFPTLETKAVNLTVQWPGASAEDVEANILQVIEPQVRFVDGVSKMTSYAREGSGTIVLEFERDTDMQTAAADVDAAAKAVTTLPDDAEPVKVSAVSFFDSVANLSISGDVPESTLRYYAKKIRDDLIARGIDKIEFKGMRDEELQVDIPERELRRLQMSVGDVSARIAGNSRDIPSGQIEGRVDQQLRTLAEFDTPRSLGEIEVKSFGSGEKIRLGDIATIRYGFEKGQTQGFSNGKRAIEIGVRRAPTADTLETARILEEYLEQLRPALPANLEIHEYEVAADALKARLMLLVRNGLSGLVLVVGVLFLFLNARIAFWVAAGIPVATLATLGCMLVLGQSINMISLFGLIMVLGIIVDDAIVVGEHTATRHAMGDPPFEAAEEGAGRMIVPVVAAMTTTVAAFAPILLIRDTLGQIMGVLPLIVISVLVASLVECFFVLPAHLAHALKPVRTRGWSYMRHLAFSFAIGAFLLVLAERGDPSSNPVAANIAIVREQFPLPLFVLILASASFLAGAAIEAAVTLLRSRARLQTGAPEDASSFRRAFDRGFEWFRDVPFNVTARLSYDWRYVTLSIAIALMMTLAIGLVRGGHVRFVFFPSPEAENVRGQLVLHPGTPESEAIAAIAAVEASIVRTATELAGDPARIVNAVFVTLGRSGRNVGDNLVEFDIQLVASEFRDIRTPRFVTAWRNNVPEMQSFRRFSIFERHGGPPGRDVDLQLSGADAATLKSAAGEVIELMGAVPGLSGVADNLPWGKPELVMKLTPRGSAHGFTIEEVGRQVRDAFEGAIPRRFARGDDEVAIRVSMVAPRPGGAALRNFELWSPAGQFVPLSEVVDLGEEQGFSSILRENGRSVIGITGDLDTDVTTTEAAIQQLTEAGLPAIAQKYGLEWKFGGRAEERQKAFEDLNLGLLMALAVIYINLAWVFSSYWRPLAIMAIIPFGLVGAVFGHWLLGFSLTIMSMVSLLGLAGILVNDSIVLVSRMDERISEGEGLREALVGASRDRLRAVLLTSLTTIGGLVPLMFERSVQAQFILPMAITLVFGLGLATLLVLFLVPALVGVGADIGTAVRAIYSGRQQSMHPAE